MPAVNQNFSIPQGTASQVDFVVNPKVGETLLGSVIYWNVFALIQDIVQGPAIIQKQLDAGIQIDDPVAQTFHANLVRSDTETLVPGNYYHEIVIVDGSGNPTTTTEGVMTLTARASTW